MTDIISSPHHHNPSTCLSVLASAISSSPHLLHLQYLAEGNANVIYTLHLHPHPPTPPYSPPHPSQPFSYADAYTSTHPPSGASVTHTQQLLARHAECAVLRLRKDLPFTVPAKDLLDGFEGKIKPLFTPGYEDILLQQRVVRLTEEMVGVADGILRELEGEEIKGDDVIAGVVVDVVGGTEVGESVEVLVQQGDGDANTTTTRSKKRRVRPAGRRGVYLPPFSEEGYGILMPNLLTLGQEPQAQPHSEQKTRLLEFKAKWLTQSPSAPSQAIRCRTCAVNMSRRATPKHKPTHAKKKGRGDSGFCPFALLSSEPDVLGGALGKMGLFSGDGSAAAAAAGGGVAGGSAYGGSGDDEQKKANVTIQAQFVEKVQPILRHLQVLQKRFGGVGVEDFRGLGSASSSSASTAPATVRETQKPNHAGTDTDGERKRDRDTENDVSVAMALRDCSVFIVLSSQSPRSVPSVSGPTASAEVMKAIKLADLDLKLPTPDKIQRWGEVESGLIQGGWYTESTTTLLGNPDRDEDNGGKGFGNGGGKGSGDVEGEEYACFCGGRT